MSFVIYCSSISALIIVDTILSSANIVQYFDDSICGDEVTKGKPDPEVFLKSCQKLGVNVDEAIVLEDSEAGIQASAAAGIALGQKLKKMEITPSTPKFSSVGKFFDFSPK